MAVINHSKKFVFVHIPKSAGTSVTKLLSQFTTYKDLEIGGTHFGELVQGPYGKRFGLYKHATAAAIRNVMGEKDWGSYFTFSFVRDPYARAVSTYNFLRNWDGCPHPVKEKMLSFESFDDFIVSDYIESNKGPDEIFRPQTYWITDPADRNQVLVDKVFRIEDFDAAAEEIFLSGRIEGWPKDAKLLELNKSKKEATISSIGKDGVLAVNKLYRRDFELLGYKMKIV